MVRKPIKKPGAQEIKRIYKTRRPLIQMKLVPLPGWKEGEIKWRPIAREAYAETYDKYTQ